MATKIVTKNSSTASAVPTASDLVQGELAVNVADKRLFTEDNGGSIVELGTNPSTIDINAGTIDGTAIGASSASTGAFTTLTASGVLTANAGVVVDNFTLDGTTLALSSGDLTLDVAGNITLDADDAGEIRLKDGGTQYGALKIDSSRFKIQSIILDADMLFAGNDGGSEITALTLDMSAAGAATFNAGATFGSNVGIGTSSPLSKLNVKGTQGNWRVDPDSVSGEIQILSTTSANDGFRNFRLRSNESIFETGGTERLRIDSSGNLLVGTTSAAVANGTTTGIALTSGNQLAIGANNDVAAYFNRISTDGTTAEFRKDGTTVGSIGTNGGRLSIGSGDVNLNFNASANSIYPISDVAGTLSDGIVDIGASSARFKDLYLSGSVGIGSSGSVRFNGVSDTTHAVGYDSTIDGSFMRGQNGMRFITGAGGGSERMRIDSSGNLVKVGGVIKGERGTASAPAYSFSDDADTGMFNISNAALGFAVGGTERMRIDSSGNLMVGTTTVQAKLTVDENQASGFVGHLKNSNVYAYGLGIDTGSGNQIFFYLSGSNKGSIISNASGTAYNTTSDQRLKENIADADDAGSKIDSIQVRKYDWKADGSHQDYGMVAQELQTVAPEAVSGDADSEDMMGVDYSKLVPMLIKEIQSLRNRVASLEE